MNVSDIINIVGFKLKHIEKFPIGSTEEIYFYINYNLTITKNLQDNMTYTLSSYKDGTHFSPIDIYSRKLINSIEAIFINVSEEDAVQIMKKEFNSVIRKHKIDKLNI